MGDCKSDPGPARAGTTPGPPRDCDGHRRRIQTRSLRHRTAPSQPTDRAHQRRPQVMPPSTTSSVPRAKSASSDARNSAAFATSSGRPSSFVSWRLRIAASASASLGNDTFRRGAQQRSENCSGQQPKRCEKRLTRSNLRTSGEIGLPKANLDTPALLLDSDALGTNVRKMAEVRGAAGVKWRPHRMRIKTPAIAHRLLEAAAIGAACAKLGEAEVMAAAGIRDILVADQGVGPAKAVRLADLQCVVDPISGAREHEAVAAVDAELVATTLTPAATGETSGRSETAACGRVTRACHAGMDELAEPVSDRVDERTVSGTAATGQLANQKSWPHSRASSRL